MIEIERDVVELDDKRMVLRGGSLYLSSSRKSLEEVCALKRRLCSPPKDLNAWKVYTK